MVSTPNLEKFRQGDYVQYMNNVLEIISEPRATTFQIAPQRTELENVIKDLNEAWQPTMGSELTPEIAALDKQRDSVFSGLKLLVDNFATNHFDEAKKNAAFIISDAIAGHGGQITSMRYQQQTATVNAILNDLQNELSAHVTTLNIDDWVTQLTRLNTNFNAKYVERAQAISGRQEGIIVELIDQSTKAFRAMKALFEARFSVAKADNAPSVEDFQKAANEWSTITDQYNDAVTRYANVNDDQPESPEEPTNPEDNI